MALAALVQIIPPRRRKAAAAFISSWMGAAVVSTALLVTLSSGRPRVEPAEVVLFLIVTVAADALVLRLDHGRSTEFISLLEAAICLNIVLFPAPVALGVTIGGSLLSHLLHRQHPIKTIFNLAQYAVGTVVAIALFHLIVADAGIGLRMAFALTLGMSSFGIINSLALSGLVSLLEERSFRRTLEDGWALSMITLLGNTAVGILAAVVWLTHPALTMLFVAPAVTLHLAYRGVVQTRALLEAVEAERDRANRIIIGASDGIVLMDPDGNVDVWSPATAALTGVNAEEAVHSPITSVLAGTDGDGRPIDLLSPMQEATVGEPTRTVEMTLAHRDGGTKVVELRHSVLFDAKGKCAGDAVIIHDITLERESERLKDDFLARVSHELRTPLTPIKGYAQALLRQGDAVPNDTRTGILSTIVERVDHMHALIEDLLLVSRIVAGRASLRDQIRPEPVDIGEVCERVLRSFGIVEPHRELILNVSEDGLVSIADPARVEQIVTNLVSNACKYSEDTAPVILELRNEDGWIAVDVVDRGRGISPHDVDRVFERFFRTDDPLTMTTGGVGLGLHIARELTQAMGGTLTVKSAPGQGSTFTLRLPAKQA